MDLNATRTSCFLGMLAGSMNPMAIHTAISTLVGVWFGQSAWVGNIKMINKGARPVSKPLYQRILPKVTDPKIQPLMYYTLQKLQHSPVKNQTETLPNPELICSNEEHQQADCTNA